jgi:hypothetical protein
VSSNVNEASKMAEAVEAEVTESVSSKGHPGAVKVVTNERVNRQKPV